MGARKALKVVGYSLAGAFGLAVAGAGAIVADMGFLTEEKDVTVVGGLYGQPNMPRLVLTMDKSTKNWEEKMDAGEPDDMEMLADYASSEPNRLQPGDYKVTIGCGNIAKYLGVDRCIIKATPLKNSP